MAVTDEHRLVTPADRKEWRAWLTSHHVEATEIWLVLYKKGVRDGSLSLDEAVQEALCFGWIDGTLRSLDAERYSLRFSPRRVDSVWSVSNIRRVERLIEKDLMTKVGLAKIEKAKKCGQWEAAMARERTGEIPVDLENALRRRKGAIAAYKNLPDSRKKQLLHWMLTAKQPETDNGCTCVFRCRNTRLRFQ